MKNLIILFALLIFGMEISAQEYIVNLKMNPKVSPYIDEWKSGDINAELQIINNSLETVEIRIGTELFYNDILVASNNLELNENSIFLEAGLNIIEAEDFLEKLIFDDVMLSKKESTYFNRTKRLPSGNYEICIRLLDAQTQDLLPEVIPNNPTCFPAIIMSYFPPVLVFPEDNTRLRSAEMATTIFQWTSIVPFCEEEVLYEIKVYEWFRGQTQEQAALVNKPVWKTKTTETQAIFDFACLPWDDIQTYVWQVQAMDEEGIPIGENDGYSEVWGFGETKGDDLLLVVEEDIDNIFIEEEEVVDVGVVFEDHVSNGGLGGLGTDFGVISWGRGGGRNPSCLFSSINDSIEVNYTYYFVAGCDTLSKVKPIDIQTLLYKNCSLVNPSGAGMNVTISYEVGGLVIGSGDLVSVDSTMYNSLAGRMYFDNYFTGTRIKSGTCVASIDVRMVIYDRNTSSGDVYTLASSIYNHASIGGANSIFPINVDYGGGYPSMGELKTMKSRLREEGSHININAVPISGTRSCDVFLGTASELNCKNKTALETEEDKMKLDGGIKLK